MLNLISKKIVTTVIFSAILLSVHAQKDIVGFNGNIKIKGSALINTVNGFYDYLVKEGKGKFNSFEYYARINFSSSNDSTDYIEISLYSYKIGSRENKPNNFYGYLKKKNIYFIFDSKSRLIERDYKIINPKLFNTKRGSKSKYPKSPYDPYKWEFTICNDKIIQQSPKEVIEKYISSIR